MRIYHKVLLKFSTTIIALAMMAVVVLSATACHMEIEDEITSESETQTPPQQHSICFSYTDENLTDYFKMCAETFEKQNENVRVQLNLMESENYLQAINDASANEKTVSDVYYLDCSLLGTAYLAGLAEKNTKTDSEQYCDAALQSCSVAGNLVAYPLSYKTTFLVYNAEYVPESVEISSFDDIKAFAASIYDDAENAEGELNGEEETVEENIIDYSRVETIFECNLSDLFVNYGFVGGGMEIGGPDGSDKTKLSVCTPEAQKQAQNYLDLVNYFSISKSRTYDEVYERFLAGKSIFTIMTTDTLTALEEEHINSVDSTEDDTETSTNFDYRIMPFPNYNEDSETATLSLTTCLVVNPFSPELDLAQQFAYFATAEMANNFYKETGLLSARDQVKYGRLVLNDVYDAYVHSVPKNKLQYGEQIYPLIEIALHNIIAGEPIEDQLTAVDQYMATQIE